MRVGNRNLIIGPVSPTRLNAPSDDFDEFNRVRVAGFGVERLQAKMKASPKTKNQGLQTERDTKVRLSSIFDDAKAVRLFDLCSRWLI